MSFEPGMQAQLTTRLQDVLLSLQLSLSDCTQQKLIAYLELLSRWNKVYNLTAITDPREMMVKHIADSLAIAPFLTGQRLLDVGTGAGLPGIPLALAMPQTHWTLLDSNGKKTRFLLQIKAALQIENVEIVQVRVEQFVPERLFDGIVARAWADLPQMVEKTRHLYAVGGKLWAMKGVCPQAELAQLPLPHQVFHLNVPGLSDARHLIIIEPFGF